MRRLDVDRMLREIPWSVFVEWHAFRLLEPYGDERADWRIAKLTATIANINRDPKKKREAFTAKDFLLVFKEPLEPARDWKRQKDIFFGAMRRHQAAIEEQKARRQRKRR